MKRSRCGLFGLGVLGTIIKVEMLCSLSPLKFHPQSLGSAIPTGSPRGISASLSFRPPLADGRAAVVPTSDESGLNMAPSPFVLRPCVGHLLGVVPSTVFPLALGVCVHLSSLRAPPPFHCVQKHAQVFCATRRSRACNSGLSYFLCVHFCFLFLFYFIGV